MRFQELRQIRFAVTALVPHAAVEASEERMAAWHQDNQIATGFQRDTQRSHHALGSIEMSGGIFGAVATTSDVLAALRSKEDT